MVTGSRLRQIGWVVALTICTIVFVALTFRVNAVKSEVRLAERHIVSLERDKQILETEFETRANQQQLANWNKVEFGYSAPRAEQYLESERQLAQLGLSRDASAPEPIRVAHAAEAGEAGFPAMVSPLTGKHITDDAPAHLRNGMANRPSLAERLSGSAALTNHIAEASE